MASYFVTTCWPYFNAMLWLSIRAAFRVASPFVGDFALDFFPGFRVLEARHAIR